jgi:DNA-binding CsgD family transcriptional regulator
MQVQARGLEIGRLSEGQKDCLRLVLTHMTSKEIARHLGISSHTVDQRLRYAIRTLGARTRMQAALKLLEAENLPEQRTLIHKPEAHPSDHPRAEAGEPAFQLMHQPLDLPFDAGPDAQFGGRLAPDPEPVHRFVSSTTCLADWEAEDKPVEHNTIPSGPAPASRPRPAGENSYASWPPAIRLRWYQKLMVILLIATLLIMAVGSLMVGIEALSELLN